MEKKINLDEILKSHLTLEAMRANNSDYTYNMVLAAMKEACRQTLELAYENSKSGYIGRDVYGDKIYTYVDKESILNTIKQVKL
jgi:NOL1/NOP2/fmu family ribosome biogenesis protein